MRRAPGLMARRLGPSGVAIAGVALLLAAYGGGQVAVQPQPTAKSTPARPPWTFDADPSAGLPPGALPFSGAWGVRAEDGTPSPPNALCDTSTREFAALSLGDVVYMDIVLSARFKPISGRTAQAAGLIFRIRDQDNYYILEADALGNRVNLDKHVAGRRSGIKEGSATVAAGRWQQLRVEAIGDRLRGFLNDELVVEATDEAHRAGKVGLWTRADSVTCFDDVDAQAP